MGTEHAWPKNVAVADSRIDSLIHSMCAGIVALTRSTHMAEVDMPSTGIRVLLLKRIDDSNFPNIIQTRTNTRKQKQDYSCPSSRRTRHSQLQPPTWVQWIDVSYSAYGDKISSQKPLR